MDPAKYKDVRVSRGLTYHYYHSRAAPGKPTLLFVHGFPSTSFDWRRQVAHFEPRGYGLVVPDTLGYGGTSKPADVDAYRWKLQAQDLVDILDAEQATTVFVIGHDWGSSLVSALLHWHQDRFAGFVWTAVSYLAPRTEPFVLENVWKHFRNMCGSDIYGYWELFNEPDAHLVCEKNIDSFLQLAYPTTPEVWRDDFADAGKAKAWIERNHQPGYGPWLSQEEYNTMRAVLLKGGLQYPMNYYKAALANVNLRDNSEIPVENYRVRKPALYIAATRDYVCRPAFGKTNMGKHAPHAQTVALATGHWAQLEAPDAYNAALEQWIQEKTPAARL